MSMTAQQLVAEARQQIQETDHDGAYAYMVSSRFARLCGRF